MKLNSVSKQLLALIALFGAVTFTAQAEVVVVVGANSPAAKMDADQVSQIFLGKSNSMTPLDQSESSPIRAEFYKSVAEKEVAQVKSIWSKIVFTGKGTPPKELASSADVKKAVNSDPKAIGYIEKSAVDSTVKVILSK